MRLAHQAIGASLLFPISSMMNTSRAWPSQRRIPERIGCTPTWAVSRIYLVASWARGGSFGYARPALGTVHSDHLRTASTQYICHLIPPPQPSGGPPWPPASPGPWSRPTPSGSAPGRPRGTRARRSTGAEVEGARSRPPRGGSEEGAGERQRRLVVAPGGADLGGDHEALPIEPPLGVGGGEPGSCEVGPPREVGDLAHLAQCLAVGDAAQAHHAGRVGGEPHEVHLEEGPEELAEESERPRGVLLADLVCEGVSRGAGAQHPVDADDPANLLGRDLAKDPHDLARRVVIGDGEGSKQGVEPGREPQRVARGDPQEGGDGLGVLAEPEQALAVEQQHQTVLGLAVRGPGQ